MKVIKAAAYGMCFGVRDALAIMDEQANPYEVTIYGELVHNEEVLRNLSQRGFRSTGEKRGAELPEGRQILITAHGVSHRERERLENAGKTLIDTTCPLVKRAHLAALKLQSDGYFVIVIGKPDHVEVLGLIGDLDQYAVVPNAESACAFEAKKLATICQTTTPPLEADRIRQALDKVNPSKAIKHVDTICRPTRERQEAVQQLLTEVEALVVVGGSNSNNTKQLAKMAETKGVPVFQARTAEDLDPGWFDSYNVVGLTAGTSTLDQTVEAVHQALLAM